MSPLVIIFFCLHLTYSVSVEVVSTNSRHLLAFNQIPPQSIDGKADKNDETSKEKPLLVNVDSKGDGKQTNSKGDEKPKEKPPEVKKDKSTTEAPKNDTKHEHKVFKPTEMESGALLRGVSVVVVLTALVIVYMALKTYCGKRNKHPVMVNKYGVRTRRSDIEMTPLPLDDDEEDETLFEVGNTNR